MKTKIREKFKNYRIKRRAIKKCEFRKRIFEVYDGIIGSYLACGYQGHNLKFNCFWGSDNSKQLHEFVCTACPMWYLRKKEDLTDMEKKLIADCVGKEGKK